MFDGNPSTFWHSNKKRGGGWVEINLNDDNILFKSAVITKRNCHNNVRHKGVGLWLDDVFTGVITDEIGQGEPYLNENEIILSVEPRKIQKE